MKQQDIAAVIGIVFFAGVISFVITNKFIAPSSEKLQAQVVKPITTEFSVPDNKVFNDQAINPTKLIEIAPNSNNAPFTDGQQ